MENVLNKQDSAELMALKSDRNRQISSAGMAREMESRRMRKLKKGKHSFYIQWPSKKARYDPIVLPSLLLERELIRAFFDKEVINPGLRHLVDSLLGPKSCGWSGEKILLPSRKIPHFFLATCATKSTCADYQSFPIEPEEKKRIWGCPDIKWRHKSAHVALVHSALFTHKAPILLGATWWILCNQFRNCQTVIQRHTHSSSALVFSLIKNDTLLPVQTLFYPSWTADIGRKSASASKQVANKKFWK